MAGNPSLSLRGRSVVITGGVGGLGLGCARRFARLGADVLLLDQNRDAAPAALQQLESERGGGRHEFLPLDLGDPADIRRVTGELLARGRSVDVLVNNAGIYPPLQRRLNAEGHEKTLGIAHFGHFRLTHALWPLLEQAPAARIVTVSSLSHRSARLDLDDLTASKDYLPIRAYARAKLANLLFAFELQRRLTRAASRIQSHAAHPGVTRTALTRNRGIAADDRWWQRGAAAFLAYWQSRFGQSPEQGAESIVLAATSTALQPGSFVGPTGWLEMAGRVRAVAPSSTASDPLLAQQLWERTEALTDLRWPC